MVRFLAIVIALVAVALAVNSWQNKQSNEAGDEVNRSLVDRQPNEEDADTDAQAEAATKQDAGKADEAATSASVAVQAEAALQETSAEKEATPADTEASAVQDSETISEPADLVGADSKDAATVEEPGTTAEQAPQESVAGLAVPLLDKTESVMLGGNELLGGIPGEGELSLDDIKAWLVEEANRVVLKPELPLGLAAGAAAIQGIEENPLTRAKIELGRQLYFDTRLSSDNTVSCASCHDPEFGYAKDTQFGVGVRGQEGTRNSPVAYNRIVSGAQFWDGRAASLEAQAVGPIENPIEMANTHEAVVQTLADIQGYELQFEAIFEDGVTIENVGKAIASFERTLVTGPAPWDTFLEQKNFERAYAADLEDLDALKEDDEELYDDYMKLKKASEANSLSESAVRGGELFFSDKSGCTACHVGANFTDEKYHNLGVGMDVETPDLGRFEQTGEDVDRGAFKTPTVRNVALTAPYMHDGSQKTLEEVVEWYAKGGHPNPYLSEKVKKLELTDQDKADLVAFMKEGLSSSLPQPEQGRLPQ